MHLARLSLDESARAVAGIWRTLSTESRQRAAVADLVDSANVAGNDVTITSFFRGVHRTGMELGALFPRLPELPFPMLGFRERDGSNPDGSLEIDSREGSVRAAWEHALMRDEPFELFLPQCSRKYRRRLNRLLALWKTHACDYAPRMRRCWWLTQAQFADLFMTDVRTVQRWEAHEVQPTIRHQWFLRLFAHYVKVHGVGTFRERFAASR
jgi:DNA-binding transcriptional regulator YiaG